MGAPRMVLAEALDRRRFNELLFATYEGMSEDRLLLLADEAFDGVVRRAVYPGARELVQRCVAEGHEVVLVSGALHFLMERLKKLLGATDSIANHLEIKDGYATGKLLRPIVAGPEKARLIREWARDRGHDLADCYAYSDSYSDVPMLSAVAPCVVSPGLAPAEASARHLRVARHRSQGMRSPPSGRRSWSTCREPLAVVVSRARASVLAPRPRSPPRRRDRSQERAARRVQRRPAGRGRPAARLARHLSAPPDRPSQEPRRRDPLRALAPAQQRTALREAPPGDEGRHRDGRHLGALAADEAARRARARADDRTRDAGRSRCRGRRDHHRDEHPPEDDRRRSPPRRGRPHLRRVLAPPPLQPRRRRRPAGDEVRRHHGARRGPRRAQSACGRRPTSSST